MLVKMDAANAGGGGYEYVDTLEWSGNWSSSGGGGISDLVVGKKYYALIFYSNSGSSASPYVNATAVSNSTDFTTIITAKSVQCVSSYVGYCMISFIPTATSVQITFASNLGTGKVMCHYWKEV